MEWYEVFKRDRSGTPEHLKEKISEKIYERQLEIDGDVLHAL